MFCWTDKLKIYSKETWWRSQSYDLEVLALRICIMTGNCVLPEKADASCDVSEYAVQRKWAKLWMESLPCPALACQHLHNRAVCWVLFKLRPASGDNQSWLSQPSPDPSTCSNWRFARRILCCSFERFSKWLFETAKDLQPPCFCFQNWRKLPLCKIPTNLLSRPFRIRGKSLSQPARPRKLK